MSIFFLSVMCIVTLSENQTDSVITHNIACRPTLAPLTWTDL